MAVAAVLSLQPGTRGTASASTSGRPWAPLSSIAGGRWRTAAAAGARQQRRPDGRQSMQPVQAVAEAEAAVSANGAPVRTATVQRQTKETNVKVTINLDGTGVCHSKSQLAGKNSHHIVEATFKAFARALRRACEADPRRAGTIASSKGVLTQH
ncbi:hypothetical protein CHLNCDRAFT_137630 [Chlorella variabilis]|uniref:imidazoleglycerol-phosphate dehydratase n=1 Tax=Chlorella variabilis TaxID=554065 RepID=E1Z451_CHLVA|nr:hypothetical protein CHLNCDRAFT_137630 [Chlorella variabilis]EFN58994.1 hypothetical protein CHLNCDRAFT_137630 [Chlorella variabilis]|eukprot:XP_005851096.1 hypothetical protein CHLNCDRAFT_137630 [Chlorella variabilis]